MTEKGLTVCVSCDGPVRGFAVETKKLKAKYKAFLAGRVRVIRWMRLLGNRQPNQKMFHFVFASSAAPIKSGNRSR
jgi:hypothetical protein